MAYLPLAYINKFGNFTDKYCGEEHANCSPLELLQMISDPNWGQDSYQGPNKEYNNWVCENLNGSYQVLRTFSTSLALGGFLGIWRTNKIVYEPDSDFTKDLSETKKLRIYPDMLRHLPFNTFYVDLSKNSVFEYEGFFLNIQICKNNDIRVTYFLTEKDYSSIMYDDFFQPTVYPDTIYIYAKMIEEENGYTFYDFSTSFDSIFTDGIRYEWFRGEINAFRIFILQFLMYLSSKEPDILESEETIKTYKSSPYIKNKFSEVRKWNVGIRYGNKVRLIKREKIQCNGDFNLNKNSSMKRPHIRCAHWSHYHTGEGRKKVIIKWIEPVFVNGDAGDIITTIHQCTNKEVVGSNGEELIKNYLESKGIRFVKEYYIKSIRRRYDFFVCLHDKSIFIEFDGEQHFKSISSWRGKRGYLERKRADQQKNLYCRENNIPLLRIRYDQICFINELIDDFIENNEEYINWFNPYLSEKEYYSICET